MNVLKRILGISLSLVLGLIVLSGCAAKNSAPAGDSGTTAPGSSSSGEQTGPSSETIKLAMVAPMTGDYAQFGQSAREGIEMAIGEINAKGGVLGRQIELVIGDDKGDSKEAVSVAQQLLARGDITGILGHFFSGATLAAGPIYQREAMPTVAMASTNPKVAQIGNYVFRVNVGDNYQGTQLGDWLVTRHGLKRVAVIYDNSDYGSGVSLVLSDRVKALGGEIVATETYVGGQDRDFSTQLTKIKAANPETLVMASYYSEAALIVQQAKRLGLNVLTVGTDSIYSDDFTKLGGQDVEGVYTVSYFHNSDPRPEAQAFVKAYQAKYGELPDSWAPYAYDAAYIMTEAIDKASSTDGAGIRDALAQTNHTGATGVTTFQDGQEPAGKDLLILQVKDGSFQLAGE